MLMEKKGLLSGMDSLTVGPQHVKKARRQFNMKYGITEQQNNFDGLEMKIADTAHGTAI